MNTSKTGCRNISTILGLIVLTQVVGCASVLNGTAGPLRVETVNKSGQAIAGAKCELTNNEGTVSLITPASVTVHRSSADLKIACTKDEYPSASGTAVSRLTGSFWGNFILGGGIGMIVDHVNGSAYNYPDWVQIVMGENLSFDRSNSKDNLPTPSNGQAIAGISSSDVGSQTVHPLTATEMNQEPETGAMAEAPVPVRNASFKSGQSSFAVEKLAKQQACQTTRGAELISKTGTTLEDYQVTCIDGRQIAAHCEYRQCAITSQSSRSIQ